MTIRSPDAIREPSLPRITSGLRTYALLGALALLVGCSTFGGGSGSSETGKASYYGDRHHGRKTASGERFDQQALTAAHRSLPFGSRVKVTNLNNGRTVVVRINDRGPFVRGRIIDVSRRAAQQLDMLRAGVVPVRVEALD
ncbi:septal ring lytic transglycosylase RlpA family protein [Pseudomonas mendocina]|nr:septal ring lytic transglycosylase RlpA family protein [Pseudomonas mendocina]UZZ11741.1 septal ring lytic transglycosylase RlpA family protein [Pseudomonas mendocina]